MNVDALWHPLLAAKPDGCELLIGYSGGLDSHVLLHFLHKTAPSQFKLTAIHVHHGLHPEADLWVAHCETICRQLNIDCIIERVNAKPAPGQSREAAARHARYSAYALHQNAQTCLVTAHHQDDQAETVLLQLFRGAGVRGLSAMSSLQDNHWRPFLLLPRAALLAYAREQQLQWIEDSSNFNCEFSRNFLRHDIIPALKKHWPGFAKAVSRSAELQQEAESILSEVAEDDFNKTQGHAKNTLSISRLKTLSNARQANVLRYWLRTCKLPMPSLQKILQIQTDVFNAGQDKMPLVVWEGVDIRRFHDDLYAMPTLSGIPQPQTQDWPDPALPLTLPNLGFLTENPLQPLPKNTKVEIRYPHPGLSVRLQGRFGRKDFKKCCQEWQVPPWQRNRIPLIYINNELALVEYFAVIEGFAGLSLKKFF